MEFFFVGNNYGCEVVCYLLNNFGGNVILWYVLNFGNFVIWRKFFKVWDLFIWVIDMVCEICVIEMFGICVIVFVWDFFLWGVVVVEFFGVDNLFVRWMFSLFIL